MNVIVFIELQMDYENVADFQFRKNENVGSMRSQRAINQFS